MERIVKLQQSRTFCCRSFCSATQVARGQITSKFWLKAYLIWWVCVCVCHLCVVVLVARGWVDDRAARSSEWACLTTFSEPCPCLGTIFFFMLYRHISNSLGKEIWKKTLEVWLTKQEPSMMVRSGISCHCKSQVSKAYAKSFFFLLFSI